MLTPSPSHYGISSCSCLSCCSVRQHHLVQLALKFMQQCLCFLMQVQQCQALQDALDAANTQITQLVEQHDYHQQMQQPLPQVQLSRKASCCCCQSNPASSAESTELKQQVCRQQQELDSQRRELEKQHQELEAAADQLQALTRLLAIKEDSLAYAERHSSSLEKQVSCLIHVHLAVCCPIAVTYWLVSVWQCVSFAVCIVANLSWLGRVSCMHMMRCMSGITTHYCHCWTCSWKQPTSSCWSHTCTSRHLALIKQCVRHTAPWLVLLQHLTTHTFNSN